MKVYRHENRSRQRKHHGRDHCPKSFQVDVALGRWIENTEGHDRTDTKNILQRCRDETKNDAVPHMTFKETKEYTDVANDGHDQC